MKIRQGFVSNSSSSSFVIDGSKYPETNVIKYVLKIIDAHNIIESDEHISRDFQSFMSIENYKNGQEALNSFGDSCCDSYEDYYQGEYDRIRKINNTVIVVDSINDNSIPWEIQDALENIGIRLHWG